MYARDKHEVNSRYSRWTLFPIFLLSAEILTKFYKTLYGNFFIWLTNCQLGKPVIIMKLLKTFNKCLLNIGESGWLTGYQSYLPSLWPGIESWTLHLGWDWSIKPYLMPRGFLWVLWFSFLGKFDFHAKIWAVEPLSFSLWLGRMGNHFFQNWH